MSGQMTTCPLIIKKRLLNTLKLSPDALSTESLPMKSLKLIVNGLISMMLGMLLEEIGRDDYV